MSAIIMLNLLCFEKGSSLSRQKAQVLVESLLSKLSCKCCFMVVLSFLKLSLFKKRLYWLHVNNVYIFFTYLL